MNSILNKKFPNDRYMGISLVLIVINLVVFVTLSVCMHRDYGLYMRLVTEMCLSLPAVIYEKAFWVVLTYAFVNLDFLSLLFHSLFLLMFGLNFERRVGSKEFAFFYFTATVASALLSLLTSYLTGHVGFVLGANAVIYALAFLFSLLYRNDYVYLFFALPVRMPFLVIILLALDFIYYFAGMSTVDAVLINVYGVLYAFAYAAIRMRLKPLEFFKSLFRGRY